MIEGFNAESSIPELDPQVVRDTLTRADDIRHLEDRWKALGPKANLLRLIDGMAHHYGGDDLETRSMIARSNLLLLDALSRQHNIDYLETLLVTTPVDDEVAPTDPVEEPEHPQSHAA